MYFLWLRDEQAGPFTTEQVQALWRERTIDGEILFWREGEADWQPLHAVHHLVADVPARMVITGFWRRLAAFLIDSLILWAAGFGSGLLLFDFYMRLGSEGIFLGLAVAAVYFGLFDSVWGAGQTPGKRAMRIRVVNRTGTCLSPSRALLRYLVFSLPFWIGKALQVGLWPLNLATGLLASFALISGCVLAYLFVFNRRTRQSLHDLAVGSYVLNRASPRGALAPSIWRGHVVAAAIIALGLGGLGAAAGAHYLSEPSLRGMLAVHAALLATGETQTVVVTDGTLFPYIAGQSSPAQNYVIRAQLRKRPRDVAVMSAQLAALALKTDPAILQDGHLAIVTRYGYDIGLASGSIVNTETHPPAEWKKTTSLSD